MSEGRHQVTPTKTYPLSTVAAWSGATAAITFLATGSVVIGLQSHWNATIWGPVAAWAAAVVTFSAVALAFKQNRQSRKDIEHERELANTRHAEVVAQAKTQLKTQLDEQRRTAQVNAVRVICEAAATVATLTAVLPVKAKKHSNDPGYMNQQKMDWAVATFTPMMSVNLAVVDIEDDELMEKAQDIVAALVYLRKTVTPDPRLKIPTDWNKVPHASATLTKKSEDLQFALASRLQPAFMGFIARHADEVLDEQDDSTK